jgi:hypothetical protein
MEAHLDNDILSRFAWQNNTSNDPLPSENHGQRSSDNNHHQSSGNNDQQTMGNDGPDLFIPQLT